MAIWNILLYSFGAVLALRSLLSLMAQHKHYLEQSLSLESLPKRPLRTDPSTDEPALAASPSHGKNAAA